MGRGGAEAIFRLSKVENAPRSINLVESVAEYPVLEAYAPILVDLPKEVFSRLGYSDSLSDYLEDKLEKYSRDDVPNAVSVEDSEEL